MLVLTLWKEAYSRDCGAIDQNISSKNTLGFLLWISLNPQFKMYIIILNSDSVIKLNVSCDVMHIMILKHVEFIL